MDELGKRLKQLLKDKGVTQKELAELLGTTKQYVSNICNGNGTLGKLNASKIANYFNVPVSWILFGVEQEPSAPTVPCINAFVIGGSLSEQIDGGNINTLDRVITPVGGAEMAIEVSGDSMEPEYPKGARLFCRRIDDLSFIEWGKVYVLDTTQGAIVKEIQPGENEGTFMCKSINAERYKPFEIPVSCVRGLWRILAVLILK